MKTFLHNDNTFAIIDGELWLKLPLAVPALVEATADVPHKSRGRRPGSKNSPETSLSMTDAQRRIREYRPRKHLGPEAEEIVKADIQAGMSLTETCKKYEISVSTYYRLKNELQSRPVQEE